MQCLFFGVFRALAATFRTVNDVIARVTLSFFVFGKLVGVSFGQNPQVAQRIVENRQEAVNPSIGTRLAQVEQFTK